MNNGLISSRLDEALSFYFSLGGELGSHHHFLSSRGLLRAIRAGRGMNK